MESACQVKGCKTTTTTTPTKKPSKAGLAHDDARAQQSKESNNNNNNNNSSNCSDDEPNDERLAACKKSAKRNAKPVASTNNNNNNNNNNNAVDNRNISNKVPSSGKGTMTTTTTTTPEIPYSKVVNGSTTTTTTTTRGTSGEVKRLSRTSSPESEAPSNKAAPSNSRSSPTTTSELSYSKIVSSGRTSGKKYVIERARPKPNSQDPDVQQRHAVLSYEQVCRLNGVMDEVVSIHGRGNFPTLEVRLRELVTVVKAKLEAEPGQGGAGLAVRDVRLNGGAASHVLATRSQPYNDLDLIFGVELASSPGRNYDKVKAAVLGSLFDLLPEGVSRARITPCSLKEAYVSKMVKVSNDGDRWSLMSLGNSRGHRNVELKFVDTMRRQFEFSVDSFQIVLDSLLLFHETSKVAMTETLYPTVVGESVYGDFHEALYHLQNRLISTRHPEEIRGGGLLKYCNLLVKKYKPAQADYIKTLERYMCSRFFIDFPDIGQQRAKLENYLWNHFVGPEEEALKYQYLMLLHNVVEESTVCLMGHERRQTLALIESLAYHVMYEEQQRLSSQQQQQQQQQQPQQTQTQQTQQQQQQQQTTTSPSPSATATLVYANGFYYAPLIPAGCYTCTCPTHWMACSS